MSVLRKYGGKMNQYMWEIIRKGIGIHYWSLKSIVPEIDKSSNYDFIYLLFLTLH